jgi:hypothetical protein
MEDEKLQLFLKELDLIDSTISRLDLQIQKSKTICITLWAAWNGWFISNKINEDVDLGLAVSCSILFPALFWIVDFHYRKALMTTSRRQILMSLFLNRLNSENDDFPILDPVGWLYRYDVEAVVSSVKYTLSNEQKLQLTSKLSWWRILIYKEVAWFYFPLILASGILGWILKYSC